MNSMKIKILALITAALVFSTGITGCFGKTEEKAGQESQQTQQKPTTIEVPNTGNTADDSGKKDEQEEELTNLIKTREQDASLSFPKDWSEGEVPEDGPNLIARKEEYLGVTVLTYDREDTTLKDFTDSYREDLKSQDEQMKMIDASEVGAPAGAEALQFEASGNFGGVQGHGLIRIVKKDNKYYIISAMGNEQLFSENRKLLTKILNSFKLLNSGEDTEQQNSEAADNASEGSAETEQPVEGN